MVIVSTAHVGLVFNQSQIVFHQPFGFLPIKSRLLAMFWLISFAPYFFETEEILSEAKSHFF